MAIKGIEQLERFLAEVGMPPKLSDFGAPDSLIEELVEDVMTYMSRPLRQHPKIFTREDLRQIIEQCF